MPRIFLVLLGALLPMGGALFWMAPIAVGIVGDKFFVAFFGWTKDYIIITMMTGIIGTIIGTLALLEGVNREK